MERTRYKGQRRRNSSCAVSSWSYERVWYFRGFERVEIVVSDSGQQWLRFCVLIRPQWTEGNPYRLWFLECRAESRLLWGTASRVHWVQGGRGRNWNPGDLLRTSDGWKWTIFRGKNSIEDRSGRIWKANEERHKMYGTGENSDNLCHRILKKVFWENI